MSTIEYELQDSASVPALTMRNDAVAQHVSCVSPRNAAVKLFAEVEGE